MQVTDDLVNRYSLTTAYTFQVNSYVDAFQ